MPRQFVTKRRYQEDLDTIDGAVKDKVCVAVTTGHSFINGQTLVYCSLLGLTGLMDACIRPSM